MLYALTITIAAGLLVLLLPLAAIVLWRVFPVVLFIPMVVPFFWRWRAGRRERVSFVRRRDEHRPSSNGHSAGDGHAIEGSSRPVDDE